MRLSGLLTDAERRALEGLVGGIDFDAVLVEPLPGWLAGLVPSVGGVTIGRRIHLRPGAFEADRDAFLDLLAHEVAHVAQWRRQGPMGFLVRYLLDYASLRARGHGHVEAYMGIPAEQEARAVAGRRVGLRPE